MASVTTTTQTVTWNGVTGSWNVVANWSNNALPSASDDVVISSGDAQITSNVGTIASLTDGATVSDYGGSLNVLGVVTVSSGVIDLQNGGALTTSAAFDASNGGRLKIDAYGGSGGSHVTIGGNLVNASTGYYSDGGVSVGNGGMSHADSLAVDGTFTNTGRTDLYSGIGQATLVATGAILNNGNLDAYFDSTISASSFQQGKAGEITLELQGTDNAHHATVASTGGVTLNGGTLNTPTYNFNLAAGQSFTLMTFAPGQLVGMFQTLGNQADGATYNLGGGLLLGLEYNNGAGSIVEKIVATPTSTATNWTAGSADWGTTADWSNGAPDFYSAASISTASAATITLSNDVTIDSLGLGAYDTLTTKSGTDLSIGTTLNVAGSLTVGGEAFVDGATTNTGAIAVNGSVLDLRGAVSGTGGFTIGANAELEFGAGDAETVTFNGANALLKLDNPSAFSGTLANMAVGDKIDLAGIVVASPTVTGGTKLTFTDSNNASYSYNLSGFPGGAGFVAQSDGAGGTLLIVTPPATSVTLNPIEGTNTINHAQALAGVTVVGSVSGLAAGATFLLKVVDGLNTKTYTATVNADGATWSASIPSSDLTGFADGSAAFTAVVNAKTQASQTVVIHETLPTLSFDAVDGDNVINASNAAGNVTISGSSNGLTANTTFAVSVSDNGVTKTYTATVGAGGLWSAIVPSADAKALANGTATITAVATDSYGNASLTASDAVTVQETLPTVSIAAVNANNIINASSAAAGVTITGTSTGLVPNATFGVSVSDNGVTYTYTATVGTGGTWSAFVPAADAQKLANGTATITARATDAYGNVSVAKSDSVTVAGVLPTVSFNKVDGNDIINAANAAAGVTITGTSTDLAANATFTLTLTDSGASNTYTATVGTGGTWSASVPAADAQKLADGTATITAQATDAYGNKSLVFSHNFTVAETLPVVSISPVDGNDVITAANAAAGVSITGTSTGLANNATFTVTVSDNGATNSYTATVGNNGNWSALVPSADAQKLADGTATITARATDAYGNLSAAKSDSVTVAQHTGPTVAASETLLGLTNLNTDTITATVTASPGLTVSGVEVFDGATDIGSATYDPTSGQWSLTTGTLTDGAHVFSVVAKDSAGNSTSAPLPELDVATAPPTVSASESVSGPTNQTQVAITGTATAENVPGDKILNVEVLNGATDLGPATLDPTTGAFTFTASNLVDGAYTFNLVTVDAAGNSTTTALKEVDVATQAPVVNASESVSGLTNLTSDTITETATAETVGMNAIKSVEVFDTFGGVKTDLGAATLANGTWSYTANNLAYGVHQLFTVTTDLAGNATTQMLAPVNVEPPPPKVTIALKTDSSNGKLITNNDTLVGTGDPNAVVSFTIDGSPVAQTATADASGAWSFTPANLSQGPHTVVASETNGGGTGSASLGFTFDSIPPAVAISTLSGNVAYPTETIDGTGQAGATLQLYDGANKLGGAVTIGADGLWSETVTLSGAGGHAITAKATDVAGNVGSSGVTTLSLDNQIAARAGQFVVLGTSGNDHITIGASNIIVATLGGADTVTLQPGSRNQFHLIVGGGGSDTLDLSQTTGGATVNLAYDVASGAQIGADFVFNFHNIIGGSGAETLTGAYGGGFIQAGSGDDVMTGGAGADVFRFLSPFGQDTIDNFKATGAQHGVVQFDQSLFADWAAINSALTDTSAGAQIALSAHESLTFAGVSKATLVANAAADFKIV